MEVQRKKILVVTFNMGEKPLISSQIDLILPLQVQPPDLIFIGLLETNSKAIFQFNEYLNSHDYTLASELKLDLVTQLIFIRTHDEKKLENLQYEMCYTKNGGVASRGKGGIAVSFMYDKLRYCVITAHFAAHRRYLTSRNADAAQLIDLVNNTLFPKSEFENWDVTFFFGDLNYRLGSLLDRFSVHDDDDILLKEPSSEEDEAAQRRFNSRQDHSEIERQMMVEMISQKKWAKILNYCQLRSQLVNDEGVFAGYHESETFDFPPTFKIKSYSPFEYDSHRIPSYPDRILWNSLVPIDQKLFGSPPGVTSSDHTPVHAIFEI